MWLPMGGPEGRNVIPACRVISPRKPVAGHLPPRISPVGTPSEADQHRQKDKVMVLLP